MEQWATGDAYEHYMGGWSRTLAHQFVAWLQPTPHATWLDVGCGTGALTHAIVTTASPTQTLGFDPACDFVEYAQQHTPQARFIAADARALPRADASADYVVSGLALNFVPQPEQALAEWVRVAKPGGTVATYLWDYADKMEFLRYFWDAAAAVDIEGKSHHEGHRFPLCAPEPLQALWQDAALTAITVQPLEIATSFATFEEYWQHLTAGSFPAPAYLASRTKYMRANIRAQLQGTLPFAADGSLALTARAWAIRGTKAA